MSWLITIGIAVIITVLFILISCFRVSSKESRREEELERKRKE